jgi:Short C-terminal domain
MPRHRLPARILVVLASVVAFLAILAIWVNRQLLNTDNWAKTSSELLQQEQIRTQLSSYLIDQLYANVDVAGQLAGVLPPRAQPLAGPAASGLRDLANQAANEALQRPAVQQAWENSNREAHKQLLRLLDGGGAALSTSNGEVVLHLDTLLRDVAARTGVGGRIAGAIPPGAADLVVLRSNQLSTAQDLVQVLRKLPYVLVALALLLFGAALLVAREWRRQALRAFGAGLIIAGVAGLLVQSLAGDAVANALASTAAVKPAISEGWSVSTTLLRQAAAASIFYGVVMFAGAWLAGSTRPATAARRAVAPYARRPGLTYAVVGVLFVLLLWWGPTPALRKPLAALVLIALLAAGIEVLRRQIVGEHPDAVAEPGGLGRARERVRHAVAHEPDELTQLEQLGRLRDAGVLDADEFATRKTAILAAGAPVAVPAAPPADDNGGHAPPQFTPDG